MSGKKLTIAFVIIIFLASIGVAVLYPKLEERSLDTLLLLRPDLHIEPRLLTGWKNIAAEAGLHLEIQFDSDFLYSKKIKKATEYKGIILADIIHSRVSPALVKKLKAYVEEGGYLMLVYDVGTQDLKGNFYPDGSLFSDMLNLSYGVGLDEYDNSTQFTPVGHSTEILELLGIPPGKYTPVEVTQIANVETSNQNTNVEQNNQGSKTEQDNQNKNNETSELFNAISSYGYGIMNYQHFITKPMNKNTPLLMTTSDHQYIAGVTHLGKGKILFVNLPLTHLWLDTDSMFLHIFLRYFAVDMLHLPYLSIVPNGIGGIIMNLHVESKDDISALPLLKKNELFDQGPYSIDFTAGPDQDKFGDNQGTNAVHNVDVQNWIHYLLSLGHIIGSDGGWIHNYYGINVSESNQAEFQKFVTMNIEALEKITNKKVLEYVPSMGNQPNWVTRYLEKENFLGYYVLSNIGVGPTQNFRDGVFDDPHLWSYPPLPYQNAACFRDFGFINLPVEIVNKWITQSLEFVSSKHTARLMYFHPSDLPSFPQYLESLKIWLSSAKRMTQEGSFQWYSMVGLSKFLNKRRDVAWIVRNKNDYKTIQATHPLSLASQTWLIRKDIYNKPEITIGTGHIREDERNWIVTAGDVKQFEFRYHEY